MQFKKQHQNLKKKKIRARIIIYIIMGYKKDVWSILITGTPRAIGYNIRIWGNFHKASIILTILAVK
jgi:hypothetical protein